MKHSCAHLVVRAAEAARGFPLKVDFGGGLLQEVRDPLHQEVPVFEVGKQEGHFVFGADWQGSGKDVTAIGFLNDGHLVNTESSNQHIRVEVCYPTRTRGSRNTFGFQVNV